MKGKSSPIRKQIEIAFQKWFAGVEMSEEDFEILYQRAKHDMVNSWMSADETMEKHFRIYSRTKPQGVA